MTTTTLPTTSTTANASSVLASLTGSGGVSQKNLQQTDFLTLLTAQMKSQDPFDPMSNSDMVAQMATISNSSGIAEMNASLRTIQTQMADSRLGGAASWIGRSMLVQSNIAAADSAGQYAGQVSLGAASSDVNVDLVDGSGNVVHTIAMGAQPAGDATFYWDGTDGQGNRLASTPLQVRVRGTTPTQVATWASIAAVQSPADGTATKLITSLGSYDPTDALSLS
jgi:flagellar basal-body rod modification protein FlgD